jgi:hypothetical protein
MQETSKNIMDEILNSIYSPKPKNEQQDPTTIKELLDTCYKMVYNELIQHYTPDELSNLFMYFVVSIYNYRVSVRHIFKSEEGDKLANELRFISVGSAFTKVNDYINKLSNIKPLLIDLATNYEDLYDLDSYFYGTYHVVHCYSIQDTFIKIISKYIFNAIQDKLTFDNENDR